MEEKLCEQSFTVFLTCVYNPLKKEMTETTSADWRRLCPSLVFSFTSQPGHMAAFFFFLFKHFSAFCFCFFKSSCCMRFVRRWSTCQCSVAQRAELPGLSSKPSNKADSCVNKLAFFHTCSVYLLYFLAMIPKINSSGLCYCSAKDL